MIVSHDITELKITQQELEINRDQLEVRVAERTQELKFLVNSMAGREVRMAELKGVIKQLRAQLEAASITPIVNDPLLEQDQEG